MKKRVAAEQKWTCNVCTKLLDMTYEIDHRIPLWRHGSNGRQNLQALCPGCHAKKTYMENLTKESELPCVHVCLRCNTIFSPYFKHVCPTK